MKTMFQIRTIVIAAAVLLLLPLIISAQEPVGLIVDQTGNVGIGTSNPAQKLHIYAEYENNDRYLYFLEGYFKATSSGEHWNKGLWSVFRPSASDGVQNSGHAIGNSITITNNDSGTGSIASLMGEAISYGITTGGGMTINEARGLNLTSYRRSGTIQKNYDLFINDPIGGRPVNEDWSLYVKHNAPSYFAGSVGVGVPTPTYKLDVVGDIHCTGKLTSDGGNDPPYVLYNNETRQSVANRVTKEVPPDKLDGAVLFFNGDTSQMEVFLPERGEFRSLLGDHLASISPITSTFEVEDRYYFDEESGQVKQYQVRKVPAEKYSIKREHVLDAKTGKFYKMTRNEDGEEVSSVAVSREEAVELSEKLGK